MSVCDSQSPKDADKPLTILVVEDDTGLNVLIQKMLMRLGFAVQSATSGAEALSRVQTQPDYLLLMDYFMPDMTGKDVVVRLQEMGLDVPFVLMTGRGSEKVAVELMKMGARDYLVKEADFIETLPHKLDRTMKEVLNERRLAQAERAQRESHARLQFLVSSSPAVSYTRDAGVQIAMTFVSPNVKNLIGYDPDEILADPDFSSHHVHPDDIRGVIVALDTLFKQGNLSLDYRFRHHNGSYRWLRDDMLLMRDEAGNPTAIVGSWLDITQRKQSEEQLRESEERYRKLVEDNPAVMYRLNPATGDILDCNEAACRYYGYSRERLTRMKIWDINTASPEALFQTMQLVVEGKSRHTLFQHRLASGEIRDVEIYCGPISVKDRTEIFTIVHDITERKRLEEQIQQAVKMETVGRLAGGVAHDFNNLLTVITGHTDLALMQLSAADPVYADLQEIRTTTERAAGLTRQLLAFSRKQILQPVIINLSDAVENLCKMLERIIGEDVELALDLEPQLCSVKADHGQIEQVIVNLVTNARDAMPNGGKLTISTANVFHDKRYCAEHQGTLPGKCVMLAVGDTGCGMTKELIANIFEPFFTTKEVGKGTGLGLSTAFGIVKQSNGVFEVESEVGVGSTFRIFFPCTAGGEEEISTEPISEENVSGSETLLVVEDDENVRITVSAALEHFRYKVITAPDGVTGLRMCQRMERMVDLVLTDMVMPEMNGATFVAELRKIWPDVKVLFMSGYTPDAISDSGIIEPDAHFIGKPFRMLELMSKIRDILDKT